MECPEKSPDTGDSCEGRLYCPYGNYKECEFCGTAQYFLVCQCLDGEFDCSRQHIDCLPCEDAGFQWDAGVDGGESSDDEGDGD